MKLNRTLILPVLLSLVICGLGFIGAYDMVEGQIFNRVLKLKTPIVENENLLLVKFDDRAIEFAGTWPVSRSLLAEGVLLMREMGAKYAVFDIEYLDPSPRGINNRIIEEDLPQTFDITFESIKNNTQGLLQAVESGQLTVEDALYFLPDLLAQVDQGQAVLLEEIDEIVRDNDEYLGRVAEVFGNTYFTTNLNPDPINPEEDILSFYQQEIALSSVTEEEDALEPLKGMLPTILPIVSRSAGAGFPNVPVDEDGYRRRINLVLEHQGAYYGQLAFTPLLDWLGNPEVTVSDNEIILDGALYPGETEPRRVRIPLDENGTMLVHWTHNEFLDSFKHLSFAHLINHDELWDNLLTNFENRSTWGYLNAYAGSTPLLDIYDYAEQLALEMYETGDGEAMAEYRQVRDYFLTEAQGFLTEDTENYLLQNVEDMYRAGYLPEEDYSVISVDIPVWFSTQRGIVESLMEKREFLSETLQDAFCILGNTGTGTTDIGVTPFEGEYMNVGTHASVANTILQRDFLDWWPDTYSMIFSLIFSEGLLLLMLKRSSKSTILIASISVVVILTGLILLFVFTGIYVNMTIPFLSTTLPFVLMAAFKFLDTEKEKGFLRNAFSHYLSSDVINSLIDDPDKLQLGGEERELTTIFTDIKGFSTVSEKLSAPDLVKLLNLYLGEMSDIVLDEQGTIDKYEGDAIMCFFGAPVEMKDHAIRACRSALRMKKMELEINKRAIDDQMTQDQLLTRIGINTGDMVVGNMGTKKKMDYTIMGSAVNLASRLEGVNKVYGTWIMASEFTYEQVKDRFEFRKLDRVRVVGMNQPVRLYELVTEKGHFEKGQKAGLQLFHEGLELFEERQWREAALKFKEARKILPEDKPSLLYLQRCSQNIEKPPKEDWDGVFNLTSK